MQLSNHFWMGQLEERDLSIIFLWGNATQSNFLIILWVGQWGEMWQWAESNFPIFFTWDSGRNATLQSFLDETVDRTKFPNYFVCETMRWNINFPSMFRWDSGTKRGRSSGMYQRGEMVQPKVVKKLSGLAQFNFVPLSHLTPPSLFATVPPSWADKRPGVKVSCRPGRWAAVSWAKNY